MKNERGFMLLEVLLLSFILIGFTAIIYLYNASLRAEKTVAVRTAALYLAEEEMNYLQDLRDNKKLSEGHYDYLGEHELNLNSVDYKVYADVTKQDEEILNAKVTVKWEIFNKERELKLEKQILNQKLNYSP